MRTRWIALTYSAALLSSVSMFSIAFAASPTCFGVLTTGGLGGEFGAAGTTASESSNNQLQQIVRERQEAAATECPSGTTNVNGVCQAVPRSSAASAPQSPPASPRAIKPRSQASVQEMAPEQKAADAPSEAPSANPVGTWAEGFVDYERHRNLAPGQQANPTRKQTTVGGIAGVDRTYKLSAVNKEAFQIGMFGGYSHTHNAFSDTSASTPASILFTTPSGGQITVPGTLTVETRDASQNYDGGFVGGYASYFRNGLLFDFSAKTDIFTLKQSAVQKLSFEGRTTCVVLGVIDVRETSTVALQGEATMQNYVMASNASYRQPLSKDTWVEPTAGVRFTFTDFGAGAQALGLADGNVLRLQGGVRLGWQRQLDHEFTWSNIVTVLGYSDVSINGYVAASSGLPPTAARVDEGKLRVLGAFQTRFEDSKGTTYYGQVDVRGDKDVLGVGGLVGIKKLY